MSRGDLETPQDGDDPLNRTQTYENMRFLEDDGQSDTKTTYDSVIHSSELRPASSQIEERIWEMQQEMM